jgi:AcrR family transcriptional regulator
VLILSLSIIYTFIFELFLLTYALDVSYLEFMTISISEDCTSEKIASGKRLTTQNALLQAARALVLEKGHDTIPIHEITKRAGVATGTYYNYFNTKPDIFLAVASDFQEQLSLDLMPTRDFVKDPALKVALTLKYYLYQALENEDWRSFIRFTGQDHLVLEQKSDERVEDIQRGVKGGRFKVDNVEFTVSLISGVIKHVICAIDEGKLDKTSIEHTTRSILQMLGLPEIVAKALTQSPLPPIAAKKRAVKAFGDTSTVACLSDFQDANLKT